MGTKSADVGKKSRLELRHVTINQYGENDVASEAAFLQFHTQKLRAAPNKLRRFLNGQPVDGPKQGWGLRDIPLTDDETIPQWGTEGDDRIISPPRNPRTHHNEPQSMEALYSPHLHQRWVEPYRLHHQHTWKPHHSTNQYKQNRPHRRPSSSEWEKATNKTPRAISKVRHSTKY